MYISLMNFTHVGPSHHARAFKPEALKTITEQTLKVLENLKAYFPNLAAVAGTGHSGTLVVGAVAVVTDFFPILVRKEGERGIIPGNPEISGAVGDFDYVIIDDLVSSGTTVNRIQEKIETEFRKAKIKLQKRQEAVKRDSAIGGYPPSEHWDCDVLKEKLTVAPRCVAVLVYDGGNCFVTHVNGGDGKGLPVLNVSDTNGKFYDGWTVPSHKELYTNISPVRIPRESLVSATLRTLSLDFVPAG